MTLVRVYVAAPYTHGETADNVRTAMLAGRAIMDAGHVPFVPHLFHFMHLAVPATYEEWMRIDLHWLQACHAVVRLPGLSPGADCEVDLAKRIGMPVYFTLEECLAALPVHDRRASPAPWQEPF